MAEGANFAFPGRLGRGPFLLRYGLPYLMLAALPGLLLPHGPMQVALETAILLLILPGISRRLHDLNCSLWLFAAAWGIYGVVLAAQATGVFGERRQLAILLSSLPHMILIGALVVLPGTRGANRFGEPPGAATRSDGERA